MTTFIDRVIEKILKHIGDTVEEKGEHLVINRQMPNDDVHWHRGYIAAHRDMAVYINNITKEANHE